MKIFQTFLWGVTFLIILGLPVFALAQEGEGAPLWKVELSELLENNSKNLSVLFSKENEIQGVELIVASSTNRALYSRFGHAMLRFIDRDDDPLNDLMLSFVALIDEPQISLRKGILGGYRILPLVKTTGDFWVQYVRDENRPLERWVIPTTEKERRELVESLENLVEEGDSKKYSFFKNNCSRLLTEFLEFAGLPSVGHLPRIPTHIPGFLDQNLLNPYPKVLVRSVTPLLEKAAKALDVSLIDLKEGEHWPEDAASLLESTFSPFELLTLLNELTFMPLSVREELVSRYNFKESTHTLEEVLGFTKIPDPLYELCDSAECAKTALVAEAQYFSPDVVVENRKRREKRFRKTFPFPHEELKGKREFLIHFYLLVVMELNPHRFGLENLLPYENEKGVGK